MNWILATFPAPFWTTVIVVIIVGAGAAAAAWSLGFDQGWDAGHGAAAKSTPELAPLTESVMAEAAASASLAFHRGVEAGVTRERARQREERSVAGTKAAVTAKERRNRVTGQVLPSTPGLNGTTTSGTVGTLTGVTAHNADAGEGEE